MSQDRLYQDRYWRGDWRQDKMLDKPTHQAEMLNPSCGDKVWCPSYGPSVSQSHGHNGSGMRLSVKHLPD